MSLKNPYKNDGGSWKREAAWDEGARAVIAEMRAEVKRRALDDLQKRYVYVAIAHEADRLEAELETSNE